MKRMRFYRADFLCLPAGISAVDMSSAKLLTVDSIYSPTESDRYHMRKSWSS